MSNGINPLSLLAAAPVTTAKNGQQGQDGSWFEAMADAWGKTLDAQASRIETMSNEIGAGNDRPEAITELTGETLKMSFLSNSSHTALTSVGSALETMARKQSVEPPGRRVRRPGPGRGGGSTSPGSGPG